MSQLRKEAFVWHRLGVDTPEAADAYIKALSTLVNRERTILPLLGIAGRTPVEGERKYISAWVEMGFDDDTIALAFERTVLKKGALNWAYMNSILRAWHQKNLHTVRQVEEGDSLWKKAPAQNQRAGAPSATPQQSQARLKEDMDWLDRFLARTDEKEGK